MRLLNFINENEYMTTLNKQEVIDILTTKCKNNWKNVLKNGPIIFRRRRAPKR